MSDFFMLQVLCIFYITLGYVTINYKFNFSHSEWLGRTHEFEKILVALKMVLWLDVTR